MLAAPSHPQVASSSAGSSSRGPIPLSRSSSGLTRPAVPRSASSSRPLQSIQAPSATREPSTGLGGGGEKLNRPSTNSIRQQQIDQPERVHQPAPSKEQPKEEKKKDRSKLTEQWGPPPEQIRRDNEWLQRGQLLGEVRLSPPVYLCCSREKAQLYRDLQGGFARVYLCTEPDGITNKALKVIDKQQLKSTKTKAKVSFHSTHRLHLASSELRRRETGLPLTALCGNQDSSIDGSSKHYRFRTLFRRRRERLHATRVVCPRSEYLSLFLTNHRHRKTKNPDSKSVGN